MAKINVDEQIARMRSLMNIREEKESKPAQTKNSYNLGILEYHVKAANGKTYGIVREGTKYYIKEAPRKDTEVLLEDYDYIGGFSNKKSHEYSSYSNASKNLEMKLMSINEALNLKQRIQEEYKPYKKMDVIIEQTDEMKKEIERQRQIMYNVGRILKENSKISMNNTGTPEAPKSSSNSVDEPFTKTAKATLDKDPKTSKSSHEKVAPFDENGEVTDVDMESDKNPKCGDGCKSDPFCKKDKNTPKDAIAAKNPKGGKSVKVNEGKKPVIKMTEEQVLAWNKSKDYMDTSTETEIGDTAPFDNKVDEGECCDDNGLSEDTALWKEGDNINKPTPGEGEVGDSKPFDNKVAEGCCDDKEGEEEVNEDLENDMAANYNDFGYDDDYSNADIEFEKEWNDWLNDTGEYQGADNDFNYEPSLDDENPYQMVYDPSYGFDNPYESENKEGESVNEEKLDLFGKTPGYRKQPMTTPPNKEVTPNGARDWNDDSVKGEKPFGEKIGKSDPFTIMLGDILNAIKDTVDSKKKS